MTATRYLHKFTLTDLFQTLEHVLHLHGRSEDDVLYLYFLAAFVRNTRWDKVQAKTRGWKTCTGSDEQQSTQCGKVRNETGTELSRPAHTRSWTALQCFSYSRYDIVFRISMALNLENVMLTSVSSHWEGSWFSLWISGVSLVQKMEFWEVFWSVFILSVINNHGSVWGAEMQLLFTT